MCDLCGGLRIKLQRFRRQACDGRPLDFDHFKFVGSLYPSLNNFSLESAVLAASDKYPSTSSVCLGTTLCISHKCRVAVNAAVNNALARSNAVFVPAVKSCDRTEHVKEANQPQDMKVWEGIILIARYGSKEKQPLKNGVRYKVLAISEEEDPDQENVLIHKFEMIATDEDEQVGDSFFLSKEELGSKMRLSHAITYFSSQVRTIHGPLRLAQTSNRRFTIRHLIVGLGRGPISTDIEVD